MDSLATWLVPTVLVIAGVFLIAFLWEIGRRVWFWTAAKTYGWSDDEKFQRETAWLDRAVARDERQSEKDIHALRNTDRRRLGVIIIMVTIVAIAAQMDVAWWHAGIVVFAFYVGLTMAAGLSFKWW